MKVILSQQLCLLQYGARSLLSKDYVMKSTKAGFVLIFKLKNSKILPTISPIKTSY